MLFTLCACATSPLVGLPYIMLGLWTAGREYAVSDLVIFALTAVVGLVVILVVFWFWESPSKVRVDLPL